MKWRKYILWLAIATTHLVSQAQPKKPVTSQKPNIIFIMADDHAYQALGAYGSKLIKTPNIDRIAKEGALMQRAYVTNSVCSPSRAVILTGKYSHINGMKDNGTYFNGAQQTLPKIFKQYGYSTAIVGKWHLFSQPPGLITGTYCPTRGITTARIFLRWGRILYIRVM